MKKSFAVILVLISIFVSLFGCSACDEKTEVAESSVLSVSEKDSTVDFNIYPKNTKFDFVDKFERAAYGELNRKQKQLYILIDNAVFDMKEGYIKLGQAKDSDVKVAFEALRQDRPEYFWLPISYTMRSIGQEKQITFSNQDGGWLCNETQRKKYESEIRQQLGVFLGTISKDATEYERELAAHDYLAKRVQYKQISLDSYSQHAEAWNIIGVFCEGKAVCEGYSRAMQVMCNMLGINCSLVTGYTDEAHMWNVVKIDGNWYHLDLTANDSNRGPYHFFFNVTDKYMENGRSIDPKRTGSFAEELENERYNIFLPECNEEKYNYHIFNSLYIAEKSQAESMIVSTICEAVKNGDKMIELSVADSVGFSLKQHSAEEFFKLGSCIAVANAELPKSKRLHGYTHGGVDGAKGFVVMW